MRRAALLAVVGIVVLFYSSPAPAQVSTETVAGTTIKVNTNADESNTDGDCSLREAIKAANTNKAVDGCAAGSSTDRDAIHFALGEQATITLGSTLPTITDPSGLSIDGQKTKIKVSGDDKVGVFQVNEGAKLALLHLTVANGNARTNGGGILNDGTLTVNDSTFSGNRSSFGGAISNGGPLTVEKSTFSGNSAKRAGGGIYNVGTATISNSTFSGNSSVNNGGGIINFAFLKVSNSTFSGNSASNDGGVIHNGGTATLKNTIVANSTNGKNCSVQFRKKITDGGYNIDNGTSCSFRAAKNSLPSTNPKLASSLANNGGPTKTIKLLEGSPAINAIPKTTNGCGTKITTDQRGVSRPQGNRCDIGAFERRR